MKTVQDLKKKIKIDFPVATNTGMALCTQEQ